MKQKTARKWRKRAKEAERALLNPAPVTLTVIVGDQKLWTGQFDPYYDTRDGQLDVVFDLPHVNAVVRSAGPRSSLNASGWNVDDERPWPGMLRPRDPKWASRSMVLHDLTPPVDLT